MPDLAGIELLEAVARHGSMSAAAAELGLSQQAVSLRMRAMERQVGVPLLIRSRRGCELTQAGRLLNEWSASLLADARQLAAGIATLRTDRQAHLRVAASLTIAEHLLPGWLLALHELQARTKQIADRGRTRRRQHRQRARPGPLRSVRARLHRRALRTGGSACSDRRPRRTPRGGGSRSPLGPSPDAGAGGAAESDTDDPPRTRIGQPASLRRRAHGRTTGRRTAGTGRIGGLHAGCCSDGRNRRDRTGGDLVSRGRR